MSAAASCWCLSRSPNLSTSKRRPVVALTSPDGYGDFIALPVTSRSHPGHDLPLASDDLAEGRLPVASFIRTDRIVTLNVVMVLKSLGRVSPEVVAHAVDRLCATVGHATHGG